MATITPETLEAILKGLQKICECFALTLGTNFNISMAIFGLIVMGILRTPPADRWAKWAFAIPENAHNNRTAEGAHHPPALPQNDATVEANEDAIQNTGQEATPPTPPVSQVTPRNTPESTSPDTTSTGEPLPWANAACDA